ncbi:uncharacterized protein B0P05DRAFT_516186 [Gilbertella persicaria]|uniref:TauD/TfdA-like domain-containing protein n=1 Tax=Rhizopus stolonifer TaxID=4846 RepID=A0A367KTV6_RHIST|nr:uncharacterized protein B0P05DRAFT_516186 [Gilbertella persicaria]KAI8062307.1 hypothetical protein B0P05DRAFT_516186 [Gilbertella persicaria]RCI05616.1 hypothetical protein CU098_003527 [Rhizopus stolonifer]
MAPPNTDAIIQEIEKLDLQQIARTKGHYLVYPDKTYPELEPFEHKDPGHLADPKKASIYDNAGKISDLTPHIGTEIRGLQLSKLTDQQKNDLALLVAERGVVFFRDQDIDVYQGRELGKYFGPLHVHNTFGHPPGLPEIHVVYFDSETVNRYKSIGGVSLELSRSAQDGWHSDVSYELQPPGLTFLKIDTLPAEAGGDTLWSSSYTAYDRLSPAFKNFLEGLEAVHDGYYQVEEANLAKHVVRRKKWTATHPIVRTHPVTGWKALYVQKGFTKSIVGLSKRESDTILNFLFDHISGGVDFQVRFKWEENSVAVWDNRVTNHNAVFDYLDIGRRHGWRVTPQAEAPYFDPNSKSRREDLLEKAKTK